MHIPTKLNCIYTNADPLINKRTELEARVAKLHPMIIAVTEVKPKNARLNIEEVELSLKGYELFTKLDGYSRGICLYIHSSMKPYTSNINEGIDFDESVWAELELNGNAKLIEGYTEAQVAMREMMRNCIP